MAGLARLEVGGVRKKRGREGGRARGREDERGRVGDKELHFPIICYIFNFG
jgi:hypothetical protein